MVTHHSRQNMRRPLATWVLLGLWTYRTASGLVVVRPNHVGSRPARIALNQGFTVEGDIIDSSSNDERHWRRAISSLLRRPKHHHQQQQPQRQSKRGSHSDGHHSRSSMQMSLDGRTERDTLLLLDRDNVTDMITHNFEIVSPSDIFADIHHRPENLPTYQPSLGPETDTQAPKSFLDVKSWIPTLPRTKGEELHTHSTNHAATTMKVNRYEGGTLLSRVMREWFQNMLLGIINRRSMVPPTGLVVRAAPRGVGSLMRGQFRCDAEIAIERVIFRNIRLSGGKLEAKRMVLNVLSFTPEMLRQGAARRYPSQFDIHAHNLTFTQDDLFESSCIRNGLGNLLVRILTNAGVTTAKVTVNSLQILPSNKISCSGEATTAFGSWMPFEVRSGIGLSSRGHVLTFPGLEVSLSPGLGVFMPVVPNIDLDIGHNARFHNIHMDGRRRRVTLSASATVTPEHTIKLNKYSQPKDSYLAHFAFDVGRWVTNIGKFH